MSNAKYSPREWYSPAGYEDEPRQAVDSLDEGETRVEEFAPWMMAELARATPAGQDARPTTRPPARAPTTPSGVVSRIGPNDRAYGRESNFVPRSGVQKVEDERHGQVTFPPTSHLANRPPPNHSNAYDDLKIRGSRLNDHRASTEMAASANDAVAALGRSRARSSNVDQPHWGGSMSPMGTYRQHPSNEELAYRATVPAQRLAEAQHLAAAYMSGVVQRGYGNPSSAPISMPYPPPQSVQPEAPTSGSASILAFACTVTVLSAALVASYLHFVMHWPLLGLH